MLRSFYIKNEPSSNDSVSEKMKREKQEPRQLWSGQTGHLRFRLLFLAS